MIGDQFDFRGCVGIKVKPVFLIYFKAGWDGAGTNDCHCKTENKKVCTADCFPDFSNSFRCNYMRARRLIAHQAVKLPAIYNGRTSDTRA